MKKIQFELRFLISEFFIFGIYVESAAQLMTVGRALTVGGPDKLLPDTPTNIVTSRNYNHSLPLIIGATKHDGTYFAGGRNWSIFILISSENYFSFSSL